MKLNFTSGLSYSVSALAVMVGMASVAAAQSVPRNQQGLPAADTTATIAAQTPAAAVSTDTSVLVENLAGIVIVNNPSQVSAGGVSAQGVVLGQGSNAPASVLAAAGRYIGQPLSLAALDRLTQDMVRAYRAEGLPIVNVVIPPQDISNGRLQVVAVVATLGRVTVEGGAQPAASYTRGLNLQMGEVVTDGAVLNHLSWQSRRHNRRVDAIYAPGAAFGQTNLALSVTETAPQSYFLGADTSGNGGVGDLRFFGGFALNDFGGRSQHQLSGQLTTSENALDGLAALTLGYVFPLTDRSDIAINGSLVSSKTVSGAIEQSSDSNSLSVGVQTQLPRGNLQAFGLSYGLEMKNASGTVEFGGPVTNKDTTIVQAYATLNGQISAPQSSLNYSIGVRGAPGGIGANNTDAAFDAVRSDATASFAVLNASFNYAYSVGNDWRIALSAKAQATNARLLPSEAFYLGGLDSVRGIEESSASGDRGASATFAVYGPNIEVFNGQPTRFYAFVDAGTVSQVNAGATEGSSSAMGAGVGVDVQWGEASTFEGSVGWPVSTKNITTQDKPQFNLRVISRF